MGEVLKG